MKYPLSVLFLLPLLVMAPGLMAADNEPAEAEIRAILHERIDVAKKGVNIVVGIVDERGTTIISGAPANRDRSQLVDGDTLFEIGSVSKVFTGTLLAEMVAQGEVKLDDSVSKYLPQSVKVPARNGREITFVDLATQSSGLPRMPDNFTPKHNENPYADYTVKQMYEFLSGYTLTRDIGAEYEYSNLGVGLLGHILALKAGTNYEALVTRRICLPLGMTNTFITVPPALLSHLAPGHDTEGNVVANWDIPTFAGAGALRSTANDMLKFISANMGLTKTALLPAMRVAHEARRPAGSDTMFIGLAWHIARQHGTELIWHNGATGGYHSFIGFDQKKRRGVVVLANSANGIDDIGFHLLESKYKLAHFEPAKDRVAVPLDAKLLDGCVGRYQLAPQVFFNVRRESDRLMVQLTGQGYNEVFPENENDFFYKVVDAQITFRRDANGHATNLVLHQNGQDQTADKISDEPPKGHVAITLDPKIYDAYAGKYELAPGALFTLRRDGSQLMAQLTGQPSFEVFPESQTDFFYKVVDAQLTFVKDGRGQVNSLILHQNGQELTAKRIQ
ncbi:MAG: serine hydrolase [Pedosphaera sp.]|nr:serine hydrolase [Pedosphaera sp.]